MTSYELTLWLHLLACIGLTLMAMRKPPKDLERHAAERTLLHLSVALGLGMVSLIYALEEEAAIGLGQTALLLGLFVFEALGAAVLAQLRGGWINLIYAVPLLLGVAAIPAKLREVEEDGKAFVRMARTSVRELRSDSATGLEPDKLYLLRGANSFEPFVFAGREYRTRLIRVDFFHNFDLDGDADRTTLHRVSQRTVAGIRISPELWLETSDPSSKDMEWVALADSQLAALARAYKGSASDTFVSALVRQFPANGRPQFIAKDEKDSAKVIIRDSARFLELRVKVLPRRTDTLCALGRFDGSQLVPFQVGDVTYGGLFQDSGSLGTIIDQANLKTEGERLNGWASLRFLLEMALFYLVGFAVLPEIWPKHPIRAALVGLVLVGILLLFLRLR